MPQAEVADVETRSLRVDQTRSLDHVPTPEEQPMLTIDEARPWLRLGRSQAYDLAARGEFPCPVVMVGKRYRVPTSGLRAVLGL
jgi:predicted DNA-binding transcriptional regulator AlpA